MSYCLNPSCQKPSKNPDGTKFCFTCGTNLLLDNRYRATRLLGAGGMGRNFLAVDERTPTKKSCVIKQFFPIPQVVNNPATYQKAVELFNREATTLDELGDESFHIPRLLAHIEQDKRLYFVQEFIDGQNLLEQLQQQGSYSEAQIYQLLNDLLPVLKFIHKRGVIHRDIKPDNIMRRRDDRLMLIDFGISKELSGTVLSIGTQAGTFGYAPSEQMTYGVAYPASDLYALGATCIHLLTENPPEQLYNPQENRWLWRDILASRGITVSRHLGQILDKMLIADLGERYQSVEQLLNDLHSTITANKSQLIVAKTGSADYRTIGEAIKKAQPGTHILVRPGLYQEGLVIDKPLEIIGDGSVAEIIIQSTDSSCILMQTDNAVVRGLTLQGCSGKKGKEYFGVDIPQGQLNLEDCDITSDSLSCVGIHGSMAKPIIRRCKIHDGKQFGVYVWENGQGVVENCDIFGNFAGVAIKQGGNPVIRQCQIHDGQSAGVYVYENGQGVVENCNIFGNTYSGVEITQGGNPVIRQCQIHDGKVGGVMVYQNGQGTIENCDIFGNAYSGVEITQGGNPVIRQCQIHNGQGGVLVWEKGQGTIENCDIFGNAYSGVEITQGGDPVIQRCRINRNTDYAVYVHSKGSGSVENCDLTGNSQGAWSIGFWCSVSRSDNKV
ncbi:MAG: right-handed parallel beta-helix repeat-containing protein [Nostoc sp. DedQUE12a]|nr:right-handed parallel beta-helix repeat-containing protein [Nostoc sp. DedQUE12a]